MHRSYEKRELAETAIGLTSSDNMRNSLALSILGVYSREPLPEVRKGICARMIISALSVKARFTSRKMDK